MSAEFSMFWLLRSKILAESRNIILDKCFLELFVNDRLLFARNLNCNVKVIVDAKVQIHILFNKEGLEVSVIIFPEKLCLHLLLKTDPFLKL
jgi:hypothetical protein